MPNQVAQMVSRVHGLDNFKPMFKFTAHRSRHAVRVAMRQMYIVGRITNNIDILGKE